MPEVGEITRGKYIGRMASPSNKFTWNPCAGCGWERWVALRNGKSSSVLCRSCSNSGENNSNFKGGSYVTSEGYVMVSIKTDSPYFAMRGKPHYVFEHRLVMAEYLGRCLERWEVVHHLNGDKGDNCIENLKLLPSPDEHISSTAFQREIIKLQKEILKWQKLTVWLIQEKTELKQLK